MPSAPIQPMAGLPTLTSSELYTQTLAAQADVLVAAKAAACDGLQEVGGQQSRGPTQL